MRLFTSRLLAAAALALVLNGFSAAPGVIGAPALAQATVEVTNEAIDKMNAYVQFLNRSMRASESLERYASWVDMKKGPTGKESIVYGLYSLYDVRTEIAAVEAAAKAEPKMPELDAAILAYVETYRKIAPAIEKANKYYDRQDYKSDKMEGGKAYHKDIAALAPVYEEQRKAADAALRSEKVKLDLASLNELEKAEGKKSRWHVRNVMFRAEAIMDLMPDNDRPVVDMKAFKLALDDYAGAVREFDDYAIDNPDSFHVFESRPAGLLSKLRDFDEKLQKAKGAGNDLHWLVSEYNLMVSTSQSATTFAKD